MAVKVTETAPLQWSNPNLPRSPSLALAISSLSLPKRRRSNAGLLAVSKYGVFGPRPPTSIQRSRSCCEFLNPKSKTLKKAWIASLDESDEEFWKKYHKFGVTVRCSWLERGELAYCSMKKAFCSMVFIIREIHSYNLQMRELLFYQDLQVILVRVEKELHASFVWLFRQVFSHTPTLMIYVMLLLANYSVYSMGNTLNPPPTPKMATTESYYYAPSVEVQVEDQNQNRNQNQNQMHLIPMLDSSMSGGNKGGDGGKVRPVTSGTNGDEWFDKEEKSSSPKMEPQGGLEHHFRMELVYRTILSQEPNNSLLLANYAQYLYTVVHNYDRAEEMFKKAIQVKPADGEAYSKYANFLWKARNDLWGAEESLLEAIDADSTNSYYTANYADFLWNSGADDTCYPI